jgi:hypothetical protein
VGGTWSKKTTMNSIVPFESTTTFTLERVTDEFYAISTTATITTSENEETDLMGILKTPRFPNFLLFLFPFLCVKIHKLNISYA